MAYLNTKKGKIDFEFTTTDLSFLLSYYCKWEKSYLQGFLSDSSYCWIFNICSNKRIQVVRCTIGFIVNITRFFCHKLTCCRFSSTRWTWQNKWNNTYMTINGYLQGLWFFWGKMNTQWYFVWKIAYLIMDFLIWERNIHFFEKKLLQIQGWRSRVLRSLKRLVRTVKSQNNFWNRILSLLKASTDIIHC